MDQVSWFKCREKRGHLSSLEKGLQQPLAGGLGAGSAAANPKGKALLGLNVCGIGCRPGLAKNVFSISWKDQALELAKKKV